MMKKYEIGASFRVMLWMTFLTGLVYPSLVWLIAQGAVHQKANGSLVYIENEKRGSHLIGQNFKSEKYFWPRPSASDYNPLGTGGSNLSPASALLKQQVEDRQKAWVAAHGKTPPADLLFASGSGIDPDISPEAAKYQIERVAKARHLDTEEGRKKLEALVKRYTKQTLWGFLGDPRVNVLDLNIALDQLSTQPNL